MEGICSTKVGLEAAMNALMLATLCGGLGAFFKLLEEKTSPLKHDKPIVRHLFLLLLLPSVLAIITAVVAVLCLYSTAKLLFVISCFALLFCTAVYYLVYSTVIRFLGRG